MESHLQSLINYFAVHSHLALGAVFFASLLEALAFVGTFIPGSSIVFIGGVLVGLNILDPWWTAAAAIAGAVAGDAISYSLGRRYHEQLRTHWPMNTHPELLDRGQAYFTKHGGKSVFLGRFLGPVRAVVPVIAGMSDMPPIRFYVVNALSALAWAMAHLVPGALFGASLQLAEAISARLVLIVLVVTFTFWAIWKAVRFGFAQLPHIASLRDQMLQKVRAHGGPLADLVLSFLDPARKETTAVLIAAVSLIGGGWLFLGVLQDVLAHDPLVQFDQTVYRLLQELRSTWGDDILAYVTALGGTVAILSIGAVVALVLTFKQRLRTLAYWLAAVGTSQILVWTIQSALARRRPNVIYAGAAQYSFPSGHTTFAVVIYGFLAYLLARDKARKIQVTITALAIVIIASIAFSRLYLGAHWFSDVVASLSLGVAWISLLSIAHLYHVRDPAIPSKATALIGLATLALVEVFYVRPHHQEELARYQYASQQPVTMSLAVWLADGWRSLPVARSELEGDLEEPFIIQWATRRPQMTAAMTAAGWELPQPWTAKATLLWLLPNAAIEELPVLPKFDHGEPQSVIWVKNVDDGRRGVVRLWRSSIMLEGVVAASGDPVWYGMVTMERIIRPRSLVTLSETDADLRAAVQLLEQDFRSQRLTMEHRARNDLPVLLLH